MSEKALKQSVWKVRSGIHAAFLVLAAALTVPAYGAAVEVSASYSLGGGGTINETTQTSSSPGGSVDILDFTGAGVNSIGIHTYGDVAGSNFGNRVSGTNTFRADGLMHYTTTATGTFDFSITPGEVSAIGSSLFVGPEGQRAWINFLITDLTTSTILFNATAEASIGFGAGDIASCSAELNCTITTLLGEGVQIFLGGGAQSIFLGAGSHDLVYDITAFAEGVVSPTSAALCISPPYPPGGGGQETLGRGVVNALVVDGGDGGNGNSAVCSAIARSGDPLTVPVRGTALLMGLGLAGLAASRKRKQA